VTSRSPQQEASRLRRQGWLVLVVGLLLGAAYYGVETHNAPPAADTDTIGSSRRTDNQMGRMMGHFGVMMMGWQESLSGPAAPALTIVVVSGLIALYLLRVAAVTEHDAYESGSHDDT
jgi:hypothetical protein